MSRRLRGLWERVRPTTPSPPTPAPRAPKPRGATELDARQLTAMRDPGPLAFLDLRSQGVLAHGIVVDAWLLDPEQVPTRLPQLLAEPGPWVLLTDEAPDPLVLHLRSLGLTITGAATLPTCQAAGFEVREPAWKSPMPVGHRVLLRPSVLATHGLPGAEGALEGLVQDVAWAETEFRYTVRVWGPLRATLLAELTEEDLDSVGPRGAAGMGETV